VRARRTGQAIVDEARRRGVEEVVLAAEPPSRIRGGALLGGRGGPMDNFVGDVTKYVVSKAPCQVILTAPPAQDTPADREPAELEREPAEPAPEAPAPGQTD
jgi:basic amino acid/polyamine antiporter, APA family